MISYFYSHSKNFKKSMEYQKQATQICLHNFGKESQQYVNKLYQEVLWRRNVSQDPVNYEETEHIVKLAEKVFTKAAEYPQRLEIILMHYDTLLTAGRPVEAI